MNTTVINTQSTLQRVFPSITIKTLLCTRYNGQQFREFNVNSPNEKD